MAILEPNLMTSLPTLVLSASNYFDPHWNREYMSNSLYKVFVDCEERAMAMINGSWVEEPSDAMLVGSYVHAALEGDEALERFRLETPQLFKKNGDLYEKFAIAERMVETLQADEFIMFLLEGQKEVVVTAELFGCQWKAKLDTLSRKRIIDVKTCKSIREKVWSPQYGYCSFVEAYGYLRQLALYLEIERIASGRDTWLDPLIVAVSKEDPPDKEAIGIDVERLQIELDEVGNHMPRVLAVRNGIEPARRCEKCRYCRMTKRLRSVVHYGQLVVS